MSDSHNEVKEALEDAANRALAAAGAPWRIAYTSKGSWVTNVDGSVTPPQYAVTVTKVSQPSPPNDSPPVSPPPPPPTDPVDPPPPPATNGFLYKFALEAFAPTFAGTPPAVGVPWTCAHSGAEMVRLTDYTQLPGDASQGIKGAVIVYSRFPPESSGGDYLLIHANSTEGSIFSWTVRLSDRVTLRQNKGPGGAIGENQELRWDYSGDRPAIFYFVQGMKFYEQDVTTGESTLLRDFGADFPNSQKIYNGVEGDSSLDSRYWIWKAAHYDQSIGYYVVDAIFTYDRVNNTILGTYTTLPPAAGGASDPNMVDMCPDGSGCIIGWGRNQGKDLDQQGAHFYPLTLDRSNALRVSYGSEHSGWAMHKDGRWGFVSQDSHTDNVLWVDVHGRGYQMPDGGADGVNVIAIQNMENFGYKEAGNWHFGRMNVPGWVMLITSQTGNAQPGDNQVLYLPIETNATPLVVAETYNIADTADYYTECFGATSLDGRRVYFGGNYGGAIKSEDVFRATLPDDWATVADA